MDQPEDVFSPSELQELRGKRAEASELQAISIQTHLEHLRDQLLAKAGELKTQEIFGVQGDKAQVKAEMNKDIRRLLSEAGDSIRKASGDRGE